MNNLIQNSSKPFQFQRQNCLTKAEIAVLQTYLSLDQPVTEIKPPTSAKDIDWTPLTSLQSFRPKTVTTKPVSEEERRRNVLKEFQQVFQFQKINDQSQQQSDRGSLVIYQREPSIEGFQQFVRNRISISSMNQNQKDILNLDNHFAIAELAEEKPKIIKKPSYQQDISKFRPVPIVPQKKIDLQNPELIFLPILQSLFDLKTAPQVKSVIIGVQSNQRQRQQLQRTSLIQHIKEKQFQKTPPKQQTKPVQPVVPSQPLVRPFDQFVINNQAGLSKFFFKDTQKQTSLKQKEPIASLKPITPLIIQQINKPEEHVPFFPQPQKVQLPEQERMLAQFYRMQLQRASQQVKVNPHRFSFGSQTKIQDKDPVLFLIDNKNVELKQYFAIAPEPILYTSSNQALYVQSRKGTLQSRFAHLLKFTRFIQARIDQVKRNYQQFKKLQKQERANLNAYFSTLSVQEFKSLRWQLFIENNKKQLIGSCKLKLSLNKSGVKPFDQAKLSNINQYIQAALSDLPNINSVQKLKEVVQNQSSLINDIQDLGVELADNQLLINQLTKNIVKQAVFDLNQINQECLFCIQILGFKPLEQLDIMRKVFYQNIDYHGSKSTADYNAIFADMDRWFRKAAQRVSNDRSLWTKRGMIQPQSITPAKSPQFFNRIKSNLDAILLKIEQVLVESAESKLNYKRLTQLKEQLKESRDLQLIRNKAEQLRGWRVMELFPLSTRQISRQMQIMKSK